LVFRQQLIPALSIIMVIAVSIALVVIPIPVHAQLPLPPGVKREEVLILDNLHGRVPNPTNMNAWVPGTFIGWGLHQFCLDALWYTNHSDGSLINALAAAPPEYNKDYTQLTIKLRKGIYWSDGVEFTADDVVYTIKVQLKYPGFMAHAMLKTWVEDVYAPDKYTVVIKLKKPNPYFWANFLVEVWGADGYLYIMPKHVFEKAEKELGDPTKFKFYPPVCLGPYTVVKVDPSGYWFLMKRRDDWERTSVGIWAKEHGLNWIGPKYILSMSFETEEAKILAQSRHELDWIFDVTTEGWKALKSMNPYSGTWRDKYPWIFPFDPTGRGIYFNLRFYPYNLTEVRWALVLAINMTEVFITAFDGAQILVPVPTGMGYPVFKKYQLGLRDWLTNFEITLPDGSKFKPFDPTIPFKIAKYAVSKGYLKKMPSEKEVLMTWGPGWWKYAPDVAEKLLKSVGFKRGPDGKWRLPNGQPWKIEILAPAGFEIDATRLAFGVADQWRKFGIDVKVVTVDASLFWNSYSYGRFKVGAYWGFGAMDPKLVGRQYEGLHSRYWKPSGEWSPNPLGVKDPVLDRLIDEFMSTSPFDPKAEELRMKILKRLIEQMYIPQMADCKKFSPYDTYYWVGFPNAKNPYWSFLFWCGGAKWILPRIRPRSAVTTAVTTPTTPKTTPTTPKTTPTTPKPSPATPKVTVTAPGATVTVTVPGVTKQVTVTVTREITKPATVVSTVQVTNWGAAAGLGVALLIVGLIVGFLAGRRRS